MLGDSQRMGQEAFAFRPGGNLVAAGRERCVDQPERRTSPLLLFGEAEAGLHHRLDQAVDRQRILGDRVGCRYSGLRL
jgi:hypothetical protein